LIAARSIEPIEEVKEPSTPLVDEVDKDCRIEIVAEAGKREVDVADCDTPTVVLLAAAPGSGCVEERENNSKETTV